MSRGDLLIYKIHFYYFFPIYLFFRRDVKCICRDVWFQTFKYGRDYCKHAAYAIVPNIIQTARMTLS